MRSSITPARNPPTPEDSFALNVMAEKKTFLAFPYSNFVFIHTIGDHGREKNIGGNYGSDKWVTYRAMKGNRRGLSFCGMGETPGYAYNSVS